MKPALLVSVIIFPVSCWADKLDDRIDFGGEVRGRFESLDGQFRSGKQGNDQLLLFRSLFHTHYSNDYFRLGVEFQDSRTYLGDSGSPLSTSFTNSLDVLQAYVATDQFPGLLGKTAKNTFTIGRQTLSIGSKRQIERVSFANVIKSYTGFYARSADQQGSELHMFYVVPIDRLPNERDAIDSNDIKPDKEQWHRRVWGVHYSKPDFMQTYLPNTQGELFVYGLDESDSQGEETANRHYVTPGFRLFRPAAGRQWNYDIEAALRFGTRHATSEIGDNDDLDVFASMLLLRVGYSFDYRLKPNLAFQYYYASGDRQPDDNNYDQFERLFGGRRTDLNNTSIHGPLTPANLSALGLRLELKPDDSNWDARIHYSAAYLASDTDSFVIGRYRDVSGQSGSFLGHTIDARFRYWLGNKTWVLDCGASLFIFGEYLKNIPNGPEAERTLYGYTQLSYRF